MIQTFWTSEKEEELKRLHAEGLSMSLIAERIGCGRNAVIGKAYRLELPGREIKQTKNRQSSASRPKKAKTEHKSKLRIVNGGGGSMRMLFSVAANLEPLRCVEVEPRNLTLAELGHNDCRFIAGDTSDALYCGLPIFKRSYCIKHFWLCYFLPERRREMRRAA